MKTFEIASIPSVRAFNLEHISSSYEENGSQMKSVATSVWRTEQQVPEGACLFVQVFHTNVNRLSSRQRLLPIDRDDRRPIFALSFHDASPATQWMERNRHLLLAAEVTVTAASGSETLITTSFIGKDQETLQIFVAWVMHVTGRSRPDWCTAWPVQFLSGETAVFCDGVLTSGDFNAVLNDTKAFRECVLVRANASDKPMVTDFDDASTGRIVRITRSMHERKMRETGMSD